MTVMRLEISVCGKNPDALVECEVLSLQYAAITW